MTDDDKRNLADLTASARRLTTTLTELNRDAGEKIVQLSQTGRRNSRYIKWLAASMVFDLIVTVILALGFVELDHTQDQITQVRTTDRRDALCPLYKQFINADTARSRELARKSGQDMRKRAEAFAVIRNGYIALDCLQFERDRGE